MMSHPKIQVDEFGPERVVNVYDAKTGMEGTLVIDNTARGPGKGGIRLVPDIDALEVYRLARGMTWKNALADIPFGGAKAGIRADPKKIDKQAFLRAFARKVANLIPEEYIAGPDMNTTQMEMAAFADEVGFPGAATGKPSEWQGLPHELGSTGFGVAHSTFIALHFLGMDAAKTTAAIEGFGNVGVFTARHLAEKGVKVVAVSDSSGTIHNEKGLDVAKLEEVKQKTGKVTEYKDGKKISQEELFGLNVDVLVPGARPDVINDSNEKNVKAKLVVEAANIPMQVPVEERLQKRGMTVLPDFLCNAGGVISSWMETRGGTPEEMFKVVEYKITRNTKMVLEKARDDKTTTRAAALAIAQDRVRKAMECRGRK